jgi:hypothetical protein
MRSSGLWKRDSATSDLHASATRRQPTARFVEVVEPPEGDPLDDSAPQRRRLGRADHDI